MVEVTPSRVAKWAVGIAVILLMPGMIAAFFAQASAFLGVTVHGPIPDIASTIENLLAFSRQLGFLLLVGGSLGVVLAFKAENIPKLGSLAWYIHLIEHELVHALFAKICGYRIREFKLTRHGGYVAYSKPNASGNFLINLGPYLFPLIPIILTVVAALLRGITQHVVIFILGVALGSHLAGTAKEAMDQYDVRQAGVFFSMVLIVLGNIWLLVLVMTVVAPSRVSILGFASSSMRFNWWYLSSLLDSLKIFLK